MPRKKYNEPNLDTLFNGIHEKLDEIIVQTTRTNGRVTVLENWRGFITGGLAVIVALVVPVLFKVFLP